MAYGTAGEAPKSRVRPREAQRRGVSPNVKKLRGFWFVGSGAASPGVPGASSPSPDDHDHRGRASEAVDNPQRNEKSAGPAASGPNNAPLVAAGDRGKRQRPSLASPRSRLRVPCSRPPEPRTVSPEQKPILDTRQQRAPTQSAREKTSKRLKALERVSGIEPPSSAWKAVALPLSYTRGTRRSFRRFRPSPLPILKPAFARAMRVNTSGEHVAVG